MNVYQAFENICKPLVVGLFPAFHSCHIYYLKYHLKFCNRFEQR